jgi:hypothetical protein
MSAFRRRMKRTIKSVHAALNKAAAVLKPMVMVLSGVCPACWASLSLRGGCRRCN